MGDRQKKLDRLDGFLRRTWYLRRALYYGGLIVPSFVTLVLAFLALHPMLFAPEQKLLGMLGTLAGGGLSFASVSFAAAASHHADRRWALQMSIAGSLLLRFALAMALVLGLAAARDRVAQDLGANSPVDYAFRGLMVLVTVAGIGSAFFGFHILASLFGPHMEEDELARLRDLERIDQPQ